MNTKISRELFMPSPKEGVGVTASTYYASLTNPVLVSLHQYGSRSDTVDAAFLRRSEDNGRTWSEAEPWNTCVQRPDGVLRVHPRGGYVDPATGRYITVWTQGVLPTDSPIEGVRRWKLHYSVSEDAGKTTTVSEPIVHQGDEYDENHPLPGVEIGKNCFMMGDMGQRPLTRSDGTILIPVQSSRLGPDGEYENPGGGLTFLDSLVLLGTWTKDGRLSWRSSERVVGDPQRTTRGFFEPTIAELEDGSVIMVMRGSNDARPELPGHKWISRSHDGGCSWTEPVPWTYEDGHPFYSPSSCSQLVPRSDGRLFWFGNLRDQNPRGNNPRHPIVLGEVDRRSGCLIRDSVTVVDDRRPGESDRLMLSNFYVREVRGSGDLLLHLSRKFVDGKDRNGKLDWTADAMLYRISIS